MSAFPVLFFSLIALFVIKFSFGGDVGAPIETIPASVKTKCPLVLQWEGLIKETANEASIPPALVASVMCVESGGYRYAVSRVGAIGLMQIIPKWHGGIYDPAGNIRRGVSFLSEICTCETNTGTCDKTYGYWKDQSHSCGRAQWGDREVVRRVLEVYNGGWVIPPVPAAARYAVKVLSLYEGGAE